MCYVQKLSENIYRLMEEKGNMSVTQLAKAIDVSQTTLNTGLKSKKGLPIETCIKIADYFSTTVPLLCGIEESSDRKTLLPNITTENHIKKYNALDEHGKIIVDLITDYEYSRIKGKEMEKDQQESEETPASRFQITYIEEAASAGFGEVLNNQPPVNIWVTVDPCGADFAIPVSGDSMEPEFFHDDVIYIKKQDELEPGEIGVFVINGTGYVKKYETLGGKRLVSLNPKYPDIQWNEYDDIRVVGKVTGKTTKAEIEYC